MRGGRGGGGGGGVGGEWSVRVWRRGRAWVVGGSGRGGPGGGCACPRSAVGRRGHRLSVQGAWQGTHLDIRPRSRRRIGRNKRAVWPYWPHEEAHLLEPGRGRRAAKSSGGTIAHAGQDPRARAGKVHRRESAARSDEHRARGRSPGAPEGPWEWQGPQGPRCACFSARIGFCQPGA